MIKTNKNNIIERYIIAGQSNAGGAAEPVDISQNYSFYKEFSNSYIWFNEDYLGIPGNFENISIGVNSKPGYVSPGFFAFDHSMAWKLSRHGNKNISLIKIGIGGTGLDQIFNPDWHSDTANGYYVGIKRMATENRNYLEGLGYTVIDKAFIWVQGERDTGGGSITANYESNQTSLFNAVRTDFGANIPIIDFKLTSQIDAATYPEWQAINTAKDNVAISLNGIIQVDFSDLPLLDGVHYTADSYIIGGERLFEMVKNF